MSPSNLQALTLLCSLALLVGACGNNASAPTDASADAPQADASGELPVQDARQDNSRDVEDDASDTPPTYTVASQDIMVSYTTQRPAGSNETRSFPARVRYPVGFDGEARVVLVSHGGSGNPQGYTKLAHIGEALAANGFVSVHPSHISSGVGPVHRWDRPKDISALLDHLEAMPAVSWEGFPSSINLEQVGHVGHSWGAYTAHAVGGALFDNLATGDREAFGVDPRVAAVVPISPQGWGQFGAFDETQQIDSASEENSWMNFAPPSFAIIGALELDGVVGVEDPEQCPSCFRTEGWRAIPFERYPADGSKHQAIVPEQSHFSIIQGDGEVGAYVSQNIVRFFEVYLRANAELKATIGQLNFVQGTQVSSK